MKFEKSDVKYKMLIENINFNNQFLPKRTIRLNKLKILFDDSITKNLHKICNSYNVFIIRQPVIIFNSLKTLSVQSRHITLKDFLLEIRNNIDNLYIVYIPYLENDIIRYTIYNINKLENDIKHINEDDIVYVYNKEFIKKYRTKNRKDKLKNILYYNVL